MAQHDMDIENASGLNFRQNLNNCIEALVTNSSGNSEPVATFPFMFWADTSTTPNLLRVRNAADTAWITIGRLDLESFGLKFLEASNTEPSSPQPYQYWVDTNGANPILKIRNAANSAWITIGRVDIANYGLLPITGGTLSGYIDFSNTDYIKLPKGTTLQRPAGADGMVRFNTTLNLFEGYKNGAWGELGGGGYVVSASQTVSSGNSVTTTTTDQRQQRPVIGNSAPTAASVTPFGTGGGWKDGTEVLLIGTSDTASVIFAFNDASKGLVGNFTEIELTKYKSILCVWNATIDRWLVQGGI